MLTTFLDRLGGLFDRRFLVACWSPTFFVLSLAAIGGAAAHLGPDELLRQWLGTNAVAQAVLAAAGLLTITAVAFLLQAQSEAVVRFFEGYWPRSLRWLARWAATRQRRAIPSVKQPSSSDRQSQEQALLALHQPGSYRARYFGFPRDTSLVRPTRLGNTLTAAEEYAYQVYRLDAVLWWPRLVTLLPETFRIQLDAALVPMLALLNLSVLFVVLSVVSGLLLILIGKPWWLSVLVALGGLLLARIAYNAAASVATSYGNFIRVAFDLYRHDILRQMSIPVPMTLLEERLLWDSLNQFVYWYVPPWESGWPHDPGELPSHDFFPYEVLGKSKPPRPAQDQP